MSLDLDTTKMKVNDIRSLLVDEYGYDDESVNNIKGKTALVQLLEQAYKESQSVNNIDFGDEDNTGDFNILTEEHNMKNKITTNNDVVMPALGSLEWHNYVMSHFAEDELINGNPTVDGMRRVTTLIMGTIRSIKTQILQVPEPPERRATALVTVVLETDEQFDGAADIYYGNAKLPFSNHPVSMAETRAEGRALKRALGLRKINAAEEIDTIPNESNNLETENGPISNIQLNFLDVICKPDRLNINILKLIENEQMQLATLTYKNALVLNAKISEYQTDMKSIPDHIKGYEADWRKL